MNLTVLYRGSLTSCNYACGYCPFAKRLESKERLRQDRESVERFTTWLASQHDVSWDVLFTPWGEALARSCYRRAIARLTHLSHVTRVAVQTNLSCGLRWIEECQTDRLALWAAFHPTEADRHVFRQKVTSLFERGVGVSAGVVAVPEHFDHIAALRRELPAELYLWINAQQPRSRPYTDEEIAWLSSIDPHFALTLKRERSLDRYCRAGQESFTVDARGDMRRCHFVDEIIGNVFEPDWRDALVSRRCPKRFCNCFLGKSQIDLQSKVAFMQRSMPFARDLDRSNSRPAMPVMPLSDGVAASSSRR